MNVKVVLAGIFSLVLVIGFGVYFLQSTPSVSTMPRVASLISPSEVKREIVQYPINPNITIEVEAQKIPEFALDISDPKYERILDASSEELNKLASVNVSHDVRTANLDTKLAVNKEKKELLVSAKDIPNFKPGLYTISMTLRTLEGEVNLEQDFAWGVLAVNTKKSVYAPGEKVNIGIGVLDDGGNTQCRTGFNHLSSLRMTVTAPGGKVAEYNIEDNSIKDSGKCAATSVTNEADFQAEYFSTNEPGVYQIFVESTVKGKIRSIKDYFKVDPNVKFDVERTSFPTRIYPFAPYPATFKITSKEDYEGKVTDIMPAFFDIKNVGDNGTVTVVGDYKVITWQVSLKKGQSQEFTYLIKFPPVSPEFYLIGPIKVGNFTEARQWQIASDAINSTSGVLAYEDNSGSTTWYRLWTGTVWSPLAGSAAISVDTTGDTPDDSRWFRMVSSPKTGEKLLAAYDNCGAPISTECIWMYRWTGTAWVEDFTVNANTPDTNTNLMDVTYEELSGEALFVFGDSTTQLKYRHRSGGSWTATLNAGTALDSRKKWVRAKSQFNTDAILVGYLNDNERTGALIWDGSTNTFGDQFEDDDSPAQSETATSDESAFDIAWETQSGTPMMFWGNTSQQLMYREFTGGSWSGETAIYTTDADAANDLDWVTAAADPTSSSNYIALAMQEDLDDDGTDETIDCEFGMWTGSGVESLGGLVTCRSDNDGRLNNVAFENTGGRAVFVYVTSADGNSLTYRTWTTGDASPGTSTAITGNVGDDGVELIESVQLHTDLNTTSMIALVSDSDAELSGTDLYSWTWDGSSWAYNSTSLHAAIQNAGENAEAYGFGFDRNLEQQVAYRWFANSGTVAVASAIGSQDTPALLTSANQQFRLRLLIATTDTLGTSFRDYKLQYVDPGTGTCASPTGGTPSTWTDVPTSGGSTVSFHNNATPSDGDNLTANGSLDPTYPGTTNVAQDYEEANNFTNSVASITADTQVGLWDFSLVDNTSFDRTAQTYCFRVARTSNVALRIGIYPQISTAAVDDVLIQGGTQINQGTSINNP